jgi:hypothetical protein
VCVCELLGEGEERRSTLKSCWQNCVRCDSMYGAEGLYPIQLHACTDIFGIYRYSGI